MIRWNDICDTQHIMSEERTESTMEDFAHNESKRILGEIVASEREIRRLEQHIREQKELLDEKCPHKYIREEYDDDFHRPRCYVMCRLCGADV